MSIKDGGPAFPGGEGMSLRDWFAGQALAGMIACHTGNEAPPADDYAATSAYGYADAMLTKRKEEPA